MAKNGEFRPTDAELEILRVLWDQGPSTVRDVWKTLNAAKPTGYTTVLKLMQIMADKGLVRRNEEQRAHVYAAVAARETTQQQLVGDLLNRAFGGSATQLIMQALAGHFTGRSTPEYLCCNRSVTPYSYFANLGPLICRLAGILAAPASSTTVFKDLERSIPNECTATCALHFSVPARA